MLNALIVVWRESLEAMLVIGVLLAWIGRQPDPAALRRGVWLGVAAGLGLAVALGVATFLAQSQFAGQSLEVFQLGMVLFAAALIVQMVLWMHRHGRQMTQQLQARAQRSRGASGVAAITALAVAREGAETVVFTWGLGLQAGGAQLAGLLAAATTGLVLAGVTAWLVARGAKYLNYRTLFRVSEILLLLVAGAMLANGIDRMIALDWLPLIVDTVWDTSGLVDDAGGVGRLLAGFVGYRARPSGVLLLAVGLYWAFAVWRLTRGSRHVG
jgi:high-affinity iron transporter